MKKIKIIATLATICLAICTLAYGVYASVSLSFDVTANVNFVVNNLFVGIRGNVSNAYDNSATQVPKNLLTTIATYNPASPYTNGEGGTNNISPWTISDTLYFNSSAKQPMIFEVEVTNYTPNYGIRVSIVNNSSAIEGVTVISNTVGNAGICDNVLEPPVTTAALSIEPNTLTQGITGTINLTVNIERVAQQTLNNNELTSETSGGGTVNLLPYKETVNGTDYLVTWYKGGNAVSNYDVADLTGYTKAVGNPLLTIPDANIVTLDTTTCKITRLNTTAIDVPPAGKTAFAIPAYVEKNGLIYRVVEIEGVDGDDCIFRQLSNYSVELPATITTLDNYAFKGCDAMTSIDIKKTAADITIGEKTFEQCNLLTTINLPANVVSIGNQAFYNCHNLEIVYLNSTNSKLNSISASILEESSTASIVVPCGNLKAFLNNSDINGGIKLKFYGYQDFLAGAKLSNAWGFPTDYSYSAYLVWASAPNRSSASRIIYFQKPVGEVTLTYDSQQLASSGRYYLYYTNDITAD